MNTLILVWLKKSLLSTLKVGLVESVKGEITLISKKDVSKRAKETGLESQTLA